MSLRGSAARTLIALGLTGLGLHVALAFAGEPDVSLSPSGACEGAVVDGFDVGLGPGSEGHVVEGVRVSAPSGCDPESLSVIVRDIDGGMTPVGVGPDGAATLEYPLPAARFQGAAVAVL